jgi:hypothetical protein
MKKLSVFLVLLVFATTAVAQQQQQVASNRSDEKSLTTTTATASVPVEPEWAEEIFLLKEGQLVSLESQRPSTENKLTMTGAKSTFVYQGQSSTVVVPASAEFTMRYEGAANPTSLVILNHVETGKNNRTIVYSKASLVKESSPNSMGITLTAQRYGAKSVTLTPASPLAPGEYAIRTRWGVTYLFRVQ